MNFSELIRQYITPERINMVLRVILALGIGIPLIMLARKVVKRLISGRLSPQSEQLVVRAVYYVLVLILAVNVLNEFGFKLSALLGAAGIVGIAVGFASQTSVSNIISGIFLISEKPFVVGDTIEVGGTVGTVDSIDLLSLKLKTADNRYVRVPNETMIKSEVINITRFPERRVDVTVGVAYKEDLGKVIALLQEIADSEPLALKEPPPAVRVTDFASSSVNLMLGVWSRSEEVFDLKTALLVRVKEVFKEQGIEIPFPHVSLYAGAESDPIKISNKEV